MEAATCPFVDPVGFERAFYQNNYYLKIYIFKVVSLVFQNNTKTHRITSDSSDKNCICSLQFLKFLNN